MIRTSDIDSLTNFQKNTKEFVGKLEESKQPMVLTVNGRAKLVVQDADAYQALLEDVERLRFAEAVRKGIMEANHGQIMPVEEAYSTMKAKYGL